MMPIRVVIDRQKFSDLISGFTVEIPARDHHGIGVEIIIEEMTLREIATITDCDPRADLLQFGNVDPGSMSPADLRANAGYLQASTQLEDAAAYAKAADDLDRAKEIEMINSVGSTSIPGPALKLDNVASEIETISAGAFVCEETRFYLSRWRDEILKVIKALK